MFLNIHNIFNVNATHSDNLAGFCANRHKEYTTTTANVATTIPLTTTL